MSGSSEQARPDPAEAVRDSDPQHDAGRSDDSFAGELPREGRLLGLDYGTRRIGAALSTPEQTLATPHENYHLRGERADAAWLKQLAQDYRVIGVVVGLPLHLSGKEGAKAAEAREFGDWVGAVLGLPVTFYDERFTTSVAEDLLIEAGFNRKQRKARLDQMAAQIMLQSFLDRRRHQG